MKSTPGVGTKFTITVVLKLLERNAAAGHDGESEMSLKGKRLLLVEDNEINSEIAEALLTEEGFKVETVSDGDLAVEAVKNSEPGYFDFVLMDIQMPKMNGYEATMAIRSLKNKPLANIPIIALSANTYAEDHKMSVQSGMDAHASKPLDMEKLKETVRNVLGKQ